MQNFSPQVARYKPSIELVSESFDLPQLDRQRRVYVLLPSDYHIARDKRYRVLYLQDAQNLFGEPGPYGKWDVDQHMASLFMEDAGDFIIVAVDHGEEKRIDEYSPYYHRDFGKGQGKLYAEFVIDTLKPHIDKHYRTRPEREYNAIGGSSMGGLISAYIGIVYPEAFSRLMIFSPSFWYSDEIYFDAFKYDYTLPMRIFIYGGAKESETMTSHIQRFRDSLGQGQHREDLNTYKIVINPEGEHNESYWSQIFPDAVKWLFFED